MFDIQILKSKIIFDQVELNELRHFLFGNLNDNRLEHLNKQAVYDALSVHINEHLRGIEYDIRQAVVIDLVSRVIENPNEDCLSYEHVAQSLMAQAYPEPQLVKNFQGWILMSTEFNLSELESVETLVENDFVDESLKEQYPYFSLDSSSSLEEYTESTHEEPEQPTMEPECPIIEPQVESEPIFIVLESDKKSYLSNIIERLNYYYKRVLDIKKPVLGLICFGSLSFIATSVFILNNNELHHDKFDFRDSCFLVLRASDKPTALKSSVALVYETSKSGKPDYLAFNSNNLERLKGFLKRNNSMLAEEPYFSTIIRAAAKSNVNPLLMFAITGQEQGFVKRGSENAALIVNNPFNVFHSWIDYNTNIQDASAIAATTISERLSSRPKGVDPFKWLNGTYAEDKNWWSGVQDIFISLDYYVNSELN